MLTEEEKKEIDTEAKNYPDRQGACIDALKIVQRHRRWISDESLADIAKYLDMAPDRLESVATFYNLIFRKPVGEHVILLCDSVSCWICGYMGIRQQLCTRLGIDFGETTSDGRFTLLPIPCLGTCDHAPALMIDDELFGDLTPERLEKILNSYQKNTGQHGHTAD